MSINRIFANAVARRIAAVLVAAALAWLGVGSVFAAVLPDQGLAYQAALDDAGSVTCSVTGQAPVDTRAVLTAPGDSYYAEYQCPIAGGELFWYRRNEIFSWVDGCSSRPVMQNASFTGNAGSCSGGCAFAPVLGGGDVYTTITVAGLSITRASSLTPTGEVCTNGDGLGQPVTSDQCVQQSTLTQCIRPDGKHCATSSTGKQFCWSPTEAGTKASNNEAATKSPEGTNINAPNSPPSNGGDWSQQGSGTASVTTGGTTNNYNITNWVSSYGSEGDGGTGEGDGDGDGDGPGQGTGESLGDLYTPHGKTIDSVVETWWSAAQSTPILGKINQFFGNCGYGGACPSWVYETEFTGTLSFAQLCDGTLGDIFTFGGYVVLALGAFAAFRIAIY